MVFAFHCQTTGKRGDGHEKSFKSFTLYLDEGSTPAQRKGLGRIFESDARLQAETGTRVSTTNIKIDRERVSKIEEKLAELKAKIGDRGTLAIKPILGFDGTTPVSMLNAWTIFSEREPVTLAKGTADWKDAGQELKIRSGCGEIHYIRIEGSADSN
jgi:hypothetical protein